MLKVTIKYLYVYIIMWYY